jgi:hypothetical protein
MRIASHHAEWLSLVETSGPFLSMPVLLRAFSNGLEKYERDQIARLREAYEEWLERGAKETGAHRAWVLHVLTELLEYPADFLLEGQSIPPGFEAAEPQFGETLRPDWVLKRPGADDRAQLLISLYPPSQKLDGALYAASAKDQQEVTEQLGYQVRQAVEILVQALDVIDAKSGRQLLAGVSEKDIYDSALTVTSAFASPCGRWRAHPYGGRDRTSGSVLDAGADSNMPEGELIEDHDNTKYRVVSQFARFANSSSDQT